jgi:hypothetical protein
MHASQMACVRDSTCAQGTLRRPGLHKPRARALFHVQVPDPPLLRQETEASHAYLSMLLHLASSSSGGSSSSGLKWAGAAEAQQATQVRILAQCTQGQAVVVHVKSLLGVLAGAQQSCSPAQVSMWFPLEQASF